MTLETVLGIAQVFLLVILWFLKKTLASIEEKQDQTLREVRITNGRVTKLETMAMDHNVRDDDRFTSLEKRLDREHAERMANL